MGARRQRFTPAERAAFLANADVQWLHGSRWVAGRIGDGVIHTDETGGQYLDMTYTGPTTRTISNGQYVRAYPKGVRLPQ